MHKYFALIAWVAGWIPYFLCAQPAQPNLKIPFSDSKLTPLNANNLNPNPLFLVSSCQPSSLGLMDSLTVHGCVNDSLSGIYLPLGEILQPAHARSFVLHTGSVFALGTIIFEQKTPTFSFQPGQMVPGQTYFISPVAGLKNAQNLVDLTDSCLQIGAGQPIIFHAAPVGVWATDATVCSDDSVHLSLLLFGDAPFSCHIFNNLLGEIDTFFANNSTFDFKLKHSLSPSYTLIKIGNNYCESTPGSPVSVNFGQPASAEMLDDALKICVLNYGNLPVFVNFAHLITGGDASGIWVDLDSSGAPGQFPILEFTDVAFGKYRFQYTTTAAVSPCPNSVYFVEIEVSDCVCAALSTDTLPVICQTSAEVDLKNFTQNNPGTWKIIDQPLGANAVVNDSIFDATNSLSGNYMLEFTFENNPSTVCPTSDSLTLIISKTADAGFATLPFLEKCDGENDIIFLETALENSIENGVWTAQSLDDAPFLNEYSGKLLVEKLSVGSHFFTKKIIAAAPCPIDSAQIRLEIYPNPTANAGFDQQFDCTQTTIFLGSDMPDSLLFQWSDPILGDKSRPEITASGDYFLTVTNSETGCFSTDFVEILPDPGLPIFTKIFVKNPTCTSENNGIIRVDLVANGLSPMRYSIDNQVVSANFLFENLKPVAYKLTVQDALGCETDTILALAEPPKMTLSAGADTSVLLGDTLRLSPIASFKVANFGWSGAGVFCPNCWTTYLLPKVDGAIFLTAFDSAGCRAAAHFSVEVRRDFSIYFPNILLPSNEVGGANDSFFPQGEVSGGFQIRRLSIRSRWGDLVFFTEKMTLNDPSAGWNGRVRGKIAPAGVYLWEAELLLADGSVLQKTGDLTVVR